MDEPGARPVPLGDELVLPWSLLVAGTAVAAWLTRGSTWGSVPLGAFLLIPGVLLALAAVRALGRGRSLVTAGPYRFVRHPYFLAVLLLLLGASIALGGLPALVLLLPLVRLTLERCRREEANLELRFGPRAAVYRARVPALLPLGPPLPPGGLPPDEPAPPLGLMESGEAAGTSERVG